MSDSFRIIPENLELTERELEYLARFLVDLRSFWPLVSRAAIGWISEQFDTEGESWTGGWEPLSDAYESWKVERFPGKGILSMYGDLRRAATSPHRVATARTLTLEIGGYTHRETGDEIDPSWFQDGTDRMPARPLIGEELGQRKDEELRLLAEGYIDELLGGLRI